jgi:hypothetical protein
VLFLYIYLHQPKRDGLERSGAKSYIKNQEYVLGMASTKKQTAFRFDQELLDILEIKAKAERRSLNNYIENLLYKMVGDIPNEETKKAIEEARAGIGLTEISDLDAYRKALLKE